MKLLETMFKLSKKYKAALPYNQLSCRCIDTLLSDPSQYPTYKMPKQAGEKDPAKVKIIDETVVETSLTCTCDYQPWACQACDFDPEGSHEISQREAVIRKRFRRRSNSSEESWDKNSNEDTLQTSDYDPGQGWLERDPETTQTFKRTQQV